MEQGQVACLKQPREKRTSDMCEIIIKHEQSGEIILATDYHSTLLILFIFC